MAEEKFSDIGRIEAIARLYEQSPYKPFIARGFETTGKGIVRTENRLFLEGIDFNLVYFPLKHLGYKSVIAVTGAPQKLLTAFIVLSVLVPVLIYGILLVGRVVSGKPVKDELDRSLRDLKDRKDEP